ncbi:MAG: leucine-rich repeat protein [Clostridia bacterium]|nr:leucine-rich repeat protein [Clostridia bacterium]
MLILKKFTALFPLLLSAGLLVSCGSDDFPVHVLAQGEGGAEIIGDSLQEIPYGADAQFTVSLPAGESVVQVFADDVLTGNYTYENGILTLPDITAPVTIRVVAGEAGTNIYWEADTSSRYAGYITSNVAQGPVEKGSMVTLTAVPAEGAVFLGWSERFMLRSGGELLSAEEQLTVEITDYTFLCANFDVSRVVRPEEPDYTPAKGEDTLTIFYNNNGGNIIEGSRAAIETTFDTSYWTMPCAREDDGMLTRDGYVLLGYSFDADGTGSLIRPGYRYTPAGDEKMMTLYCVWQKETDAAQFDVTQLDEKTLRIDRYNGSDASVWIPRKIDGKTIVEIAEGAFAGNTALTEVHITPSVLRVGERAFADCPLLTAVTLYDNLRQISDGSFAGSPVSTVRLCAATAPRYVDGSQSFGKKFERLMNTEGTKRIVVVSGSSKHCGLDTPYLESLLPEEYSVVNFGTNANMSVLFFLESVSSYLGEDDILVYCPEQYGPHAYYTNGNPGLPSSTFQGFSSCYNLVERIDASHYTGLFDSLAEYVNTRLQVSAVRWDDHTNIIDRYGDYTNQRTTLQTPDFHYTANGDFRFDETVIPAEFLPNLNRVLDTAALTDAQILFSYPPHNRNAVLDDSLDEESYDYYTAFLQENVHALLISDVRNYIYDAVYFDDTDYHLNAIGREMHTRQLADDLIAYGIGGE